MGYPPPPGTSSLPARPPPSNSGFKPAFTPSSVQQRQQKQQPQPQPQPQYQSSAYSYPNRSAAGAAPGQQSYGQQQYGAYPGAPGMSGASASSSAYSYGAQPSAQSYGPQYGQQTYGAAPQIRNPFPQPGTAAAAASAAPTTGTGEYEADMAAQIAQWQSAYQPKDASDPDAAAASSAAAAANARPDLPGANPNSDKKQTVVRQGGGKKWTDDSLLEWDPAHLRLFVGNLGGETNDDALLKAFSRWETVQKARVVRDKRTNKSKGYGFVSFSGADDFFDAAKTMNKAYIQNRPVVVRKANTEIKVTNVKEKNHGGRNKGGGGGGGNRNNDKSGGGGNGYEPNLGPKQGAGVTKPGQKTKNGLRLLG